MRELGIASKVRIKKYNSYKGKIGKTAPNILKRDFSTTRINEKWATDITEFKINNKKVYLSPIIDLYSKQIISYTISTSPNLDMVINMIDKALEKTKVNHLIIHSDQRWHYQHIKYRNRTLLNRDT